MIDIKQVMFDIERCVCHVPDACRDCSHYPDKNGGPIGCMEDLLSEARELLKEQQAEIKQLRNDANARRCKDCRHKEESLSPSWEAWCNRLHCDCDNDWFCADFDPSDEALLESFAEDG